MKELSYLVIGAGGTGGSIAAFLGRAGKDVILIARGAHGNAIRENGIRMICPSGIWNTRVKAVEEDAYEGKADVILVCVKGYSLESTYACIRRAAHEHTVVIPILNIYGTGERMAKELPGIRVLNGCIYIAAAMEGPGVIRMSGDIFRIVYGSLDGSVSDPVLLQVKKDLAESGITPIYTEQVRRDTFQKYAFVSPMAAAGAYYDAAAGDMKREGRVRELFIACVREIDALAQAMGIPFPVDIVEEDLKIMDGLTDDCTASMQKDMKKGGASEADGLLREVVRMGERFGVPTPNYRMVVDKVCGGMDGAC